MERDKMKTDLVALFLDRLPAMTHEDADQMIEECNEDLEIIEPFVLVSQFIKIFYIPLYFPINFRKAKNSFDYRATSLELSIQWTVMYFYADTML